MPGAAVASWPLGVPRAPLQAPRRQPNALPGAVAGKQSPGVGNEYTTG